MLSCVVRPINNRFYTFHILMLLFSPFRRDLQWGSSVNVPNCNAKYWFDLLKWEMFTRLHFIFTIAPLPPIDFQGFYFSPQYVNFKHFFILWTNTFRPIAALIMSSKDFLKPLYYHLLVLSRWRYLCSPI